MQPPAKRTICRIHYLCGYPMKLCELGFRTLDNRAPAATPLIIPAEHDEQMVKFTVELYNRDPGLLWSERGGHWEHSQAHRISSPQLSPEAFCKRRHVIYRVTGQTTWTNSDTVGMITRGFMRVSGGAERLPWEYPHPIWETIHDLEAQLAKAARREKALAAEDQRHLQRSRRECYRIFLADAVVHQDNAARPGSIDSQAATAAAEGPIAAYREAIEEHRRNFTDNLPPDVED